MSFASDVAGFVAKTKQSARDVFVGSAVAMQGSMREGSTVTGSPGLPQDTAALFNDYDLEFTGEWQAKCSSTLGYAKAIEDAHVEAHVRAEHERTSVLGNVHRVRAHPVRAYDLRQPYRSGGGPHSIKLTRANWQAIVDDVADQVVG